MTRYRIITWSIAEHGGMSMSLGIILADGADDKAKSFHAQKSDNQGCQTTRSHLPSGRPKTAYRSSDGLACTGVRPSSRLSTNIRAGSGDSCTQCPGRSVDLAAMQTRLKVCGVSPSIFEVRLVAARIAGNSLRLHDLWAPLVAKSVGNASLSPHE